MDQKIKNFLTKYKVPPKPNRFETREGTTITPHTARRIRYRDILKEDNYDAIVEEAWNRGIVLESKDGYQSIQGKIKKMEELNRDVIGWSANSFTPTIGYHRFKIKPPPKSKK